MNNSRIIHFNPENSDYRLSTGHLDTSETSGNVATQIVVPDEGGHWEVPLKSGIDVVDETDRRFMEQPGLDLVLKESGVEGYPDVVVRYTGVDDVLRSAEVNLDAARFVENDTQQ